jgi:hypothetical protein
MKKIISALALSAVICGAAFADVTMNLAYRQRANLFTNANGKNNTQTLFTDAYDANGTDNLAMSLSGDIASFDITLVGDQATTSGIRAKTLGANIFVKDVTFFAGFWSDGKVNGAYRAKSDVDAGNLEGPDFEFKKLGSSFKSSPSAFVDNMVQSVGGATENYSLGATYGLKLKNGAVNISGVYITNEASAYSLKEKDFVASKAASSDPDTTKYPAATKTTADITADGGSTAGHCGVILVDGRMDGIGQAEAVFKMGAWKNASTDGDNINAMAFGLYGQPTIVNGLILTVGGAGSMIDNTFTDYSFDLRARYQVIAKKLSVTSFNSWSALVDPDSTDSDNWYKKTGALDNNNKWAASFSDETTKGIADSSAVTNGKNAGSTIKRDQILANNIMVRYNVSDKLAVYAIAADMIGFGKTGGCEYNKTTTKWDATGDSTDPLVELRFSGWAQFFATPMCAVSVGGVCEIYDVTEKYSTDAMYNWAVPVIVRVRM